MADVVYQIDIAAKMSGEVQTTAGLCNLEEALVKSGSGAASFDKAIDQTKNALSKAEGASEAATKVMKNVEAEYRSLSSTAERAQKKRLKMGKMGGLPQM